MELLICLLLACLLGCVATCFLKRHHNKKIFALITTRLLPLLPSSAKPLPPLDMVGIAQTFEALSNEVNDLHLNNKLFQTILNHTEQPVLLYDPQDKNIVWLNQQLLDLINVSGKPEDWIKKTPIELFRITSALDYLDKTASSDEEIKIQANYSGHTLEIKGELLKIDQPFTFAAASQTKPIRLVLLKWNDITRDIRANESGRELIANVAHQLRTPLTSIKGYAETLLDGQALTQEDTKRFLNTILRNADRLNRLVNDVLFLARLDGTENFDKNALLKPASCISSAIEVVTEEAFKKGITITFEQNTAHEPVAIGNAHLFEQAVINLLDNAIKYSKKSDIIQITLDVVGNEAVIKIRDNGPGIPAETQARIFERFYRVDGDKNKTVQGTGLGLAIVNEVAKAHGGRVWVESILGQGATFYLTVPLKKQLHQ